MKEIAEFFSRLFDSSDWPPRWHCGKWSDLHVWTYIISDLLIWSAYFTIPIVILRFISKRSDIKFIRLYFLFAAFILTCGITHLLDAISFWIPAYRLNALARLITGILSWTTIYFIIKNLPVAFSLRSQEALEIEIEQRKIAEEKYRSLNLELSQRIEERTAELQKMARENYQYKYALEESCIVAITDQKGIIKSVNQNFCNISKFSREELLGNDHRIINSGFHRKEFIRELWTTIANGKIWRGEIKNKAKDGTLYWVDTTIVPFLDVKNKPYQYVAIRSDITQRKLVEEENRTLNIELENRVRERTEELESFSFSVSHDLRAPLRAINGYTRILEEDYLKSFDPEGVRLLGKVQKNAKKMGVLIDNMLEFSRLGKKDLRKSEIDMNELVTTVLADIGTSDNPQVEIKIRKLHPVYADRAMMIQVLSNLISNSIKYSSKTKNAVVEISSEQQDNEVIYTLQDNGVGFDMEYVDKLFGVFQRLHSQEEFTGTGVGLAMAKTIIQKHGGRIWAESQLGVGATFYFALPIQMTNTLT